MTTKSLTTTAVLILPFPPTTSHIPVTFLTLPDTAPVVILDVTHTLLQMVMVGSATSSSGGRGRTSEGPRGDRRYLAHSPPPSAVTVERAARHGIGRPSALVSTALTATPPRPGPASLLASSIRPQQGRIAQRGGRVGESLRAAVAAIAGHRVKGNGRGRRHEPATDAEGGKIRSALASSNNPPVHEVLVSAE